MKDEIINDILSLETGSKFSLGEYFQKYNISDNRLRFKLCFEIIESLENNIEPELKKKGETVPVVGLPENIIYIRK